jgi:hypothetical protein
VLVSEADVAVALASLAELCAKSDEGAERIGLLSEVLGPSAVRPRSLHALWKNPSATRRVAGLSSGASGDGTNARNVPAQTWP